MRRFTIIGIASLLFLFGCSEKIELDSTSKRKTDGALAVETPSQRNENTTDSSNAINEPAKKNNNNYDSKEENENSDEEAEFTDELKSYLLENFGGSGNPDFATSWYKYIEDVKVSVFEGELEVTIYTSIYPDDEGKGLASKLLPPIWGWANRADDPKNVVFVKVLGQNNRVLDSQTNPIN